MAPTALRTLFWQQLFNNGSGMQLTAEQVQSFRDDGFLRIEAMLDLETVETLRDYYDNVLRGDIAIDGDRLLGGLIRQVMVPSQQIDYFRENPALSAGREIAQQLLETIDVHFFFDMLISKEPDQLSETPWHNDYSYSGVPTAPAGHLSRLTTLQFWVALDDVDEENGCMQFIPGSHKLPSPEHYVASGEPDAHNRLLAARDVDTSRAVACPLPAGGCTVHSSATLHSTGGNRSPTRHRRAYIFNLRKD